MEKRADFLVRITRREHDAHDGNDDDSDGASDGEDTFANPDRRARRLRRALDHPRSGRDSATHPPSPVRSLAHSITHSLARSVRRYTSDEPPLPSLLPAPRAFHLPLERGSSLGWDQYELGERGKFARRSFSTLDAMVTHTRLPLPPSVMCPPSAPFSSILLPTSAPTVLFFVSLFLSLSFVRCVFPSVRDPTRAVPAAREVDVGLARLPRFLRRPSPDPRISVDYSY